MRLNQEHKRQVIFAHTIVIKRLSLCCFKAFLGPHHDTVFYFLRCCLRRNKRRILKFAACNCALIYFNVKYILLDKIHCVSESATEPHVSVVGLNCGLQRGVRGLTGSALPRCCC